MYEKIQMTLNKGQASRDECWVVSGHIDLHEVTCIMIVDVRFGWDDPHFTYEVWTDGDNTTFLEDEEYRETESHWLETEGAVPSYIAPFSDCDYRKCFAEMKFRLEVIRRTFELGVV